MRRSITKAKRIGQLFHWADDVERQLLVQVVRLCVLYEDFQIEMTGAMEESIPVLDATTRDTRRFYFVRRHLATFAEVEGAINVLCKNKAFKLIKRGMDPNNRRQWDDAVAVFVRYHDSIKELRNDVGGHFHDAAASFALGQVDPETVGLFEVYLRGKGADVRLKFAYEFVAASLVRHRPPGQTEQEVIESLFEMMLKGLEFRVVAVMACDDDVLPLQSRIEAVTDEADLQDVYDTERQLLYVACTRARDWLLVTGVRPGSEFLGDLERQARS